MKTTTTLFITILFLISAAAFAQLDSIKIIPKNPVSTDTVKVIGYTSFANGNCGLLSSGISMAGGNWIYVEACHEEGPSHFICSREDTFSLGLLSAGNYSLGYIVRRVNIITDPIDCNGQPLLDSMNISFTVTGASGIGVNTKPSNVILLYPNPANSAVSIQYELDKAENNAALVIYNIVGQVVKRVPLKGKKGEIIESVSNISKGSYFYRIETPTLTGIVERLNIVE